MRNGSLTAAAQMLNVSQPAVSKILRHLETQLGYRLFERARGRLHATAGAQLLFANVDRVFWEIKSGRDLSIRIRERRVGLLRVGASAPPTFSVMPAALTAFHVRHPDVKIVLRTLRADELSEKIVVGEIDLGLTLSESRMPWCNAACLPPPRSPPPCRPARPLAPCPAWAPRTCAGSG